EQASGVIGEALADRGDFASFGPFNRDQVASLVVVVTRGGARFGRGFRPLPEVFVGVGGARAAFWLACRGVGVDGARRFDQIVCGVVFEACFSSFDQTLVFVIAVGEAGRSGKAGDSFFFDLASRVAQIGERRERFWPALEFGCAHPASVVIGVF